MVKASGLYRWKRIAKFGELVKFGDHVKFGDENVNTNIDIVVYEYHQMIWI